MSGGEGGVPPRLYSTTSKGPALWCDRAMLDSKKPGIAPGLFALIARPGGCLSGEDFGVGQSRQGPERRPEINARHAGRPTGCARLVNKSFALPPAERVSPREDRPTMFFS